MKKTAGFDPGSESISKVAKIVTYGIIATVFFLILEIFTVFYSQVPDAMAHFQYLFVGLEGHSSLVPWMWTSVILACAAIVILTNPKTRGNHGFLSAACLAVFVSIWIDKGLGLVVPGFIPSPTGEISEYIPAPLEIMIVVGAWALGGLILTLLYKVVLGVRRTSS
jgi:molybdopterin-containing oxidoreductase family membrane subunit